MKRLETHVYSLKGIHLIWQHLCDLLNCQIKATAKYTTLTVATIVIQKTFVYNYFIVQTVPVNNFCGFPIPTIIF